MRSGETEAIISARFEDGGVEMHDGDFLVGSGGPATLDCPGYFAAMEGAELRPAVLGELIGELKADVAGTDPLVVYAWPLGSDGRKYFGATAIATVSGDVVAYSKSTWIELKS